MAVPEVKKEGGMIYKELSTIQFEIEKAKNLNNAIMLFSDDPMVKNNSSKLHETIYNIQTYLVEIQSAYIKSEVDKGSLEEWLKLTINVMLSFDLKNRYLPAN